MKKINFIGFWNGFNNSNNFIKNYLFNNSDYELIDNYTENDYELTDNIINNECELTDNNTDCKLKYNNNILIIGPMINEDNYNLILKLRCYKIIYISEPIEKFEHYNHIYNLYINNKYDLITGSINNNVNENKYKYPFYLCYFNYRDSSNIFKNVNNFVKSYNTYDILNKNFVTLINTHDMHNTRTPVYEKLKDIDHIECPSKLLNNCSNEELNKIGNIEYIKKFKYNICSENCITNIGGYITEKLLNCCLAGSIPIYYGSFDDIDEKIFNKDRILFFDGIDEDSLNNIRNKIIYFRDNEEKFINFYKQDVFCENAHLVIDELEKNLIDKIRNI